MTDSTSLIVHEDLAVSKPDNGNNVRASWNFSADNIRQNTAHMKPDESESLIALFRWCIDPRHPMAMADAARHLECSPGLIYQLLTGKYRNPDKTPKGPSVDFM